MAIKRMGQGQRARLYLQKNSSGTKRFVTSSPSQPPSMSACNAERLPFSNVTETVIRSISSKSLLDFTL